MQQSIREMDALLWDFQQEIQKDQAVLKAVEHEFKEVLPDLHITGVEKPGHNTTTTTISSPTPATRGVLHTTDEEEKKRLKSVHPPHINRAHKHLSEEQYSLQSPSPFVSETPPIPYTTPIPFPMFPFRVAPRTRPKSGTNLIGLMDQPAILGCTLSQAQLWVRNKQWIRTNKAGETRKRNMEKGLRVPDDNLKPNQPNAPGDENKPPQFSSFSVPALTDITPSMFIPGLDQISTVAEEEPTVIQDPVLLTVNEAGLTSQTAHVEDLFKEDEEGFLYVSTPETIIKITSSTTKNIGQVLYNAPAFTANTVSTTLIYQKLMEEHDEGYMVVFIIELLRLIAQKPPEDVGPVLREVEMFYNKQYALGMLNLFSERIVDMGLQVSRFCTAPINTVQTYANLMHMLLEEREEALSVEMNSIIDYADMLYEDDEGMELFAALDEFQKYPVGTNDSISVCQRLFEAFKQPYRRLKGSARLKTLLDSLTTFIIRKTGWRRAGDLKVGLTNTERYQLRRKKKQKRRSLRQRIETKRHRWQRPRQRDKNQALDRRQINRANALPMLRNMLPITMHQKRFRVITPRALRTNGYLNMERPTVDYFRKRLGRPVHPPYGNLKQLPHAREVEYRRRTQLTDEEKQHLEESAKHQTLGKMRDEVRRIVEDSSYSDEESSLKMNLRRALRVNWHGTSTPFSNK